MATKPLTALQRKKRKGIRELIVRGKKFAQQQRLFGMVNTARLLDDLADVVEEYLKGLK